MTFKKGHPQYAGIEKGWLRKNDGPYSCKYCGKDFPDRFSLGGHVGQAHGKDNLTDWRKESGSWNKGLTIDDPRVKKYSERGKKTIKLMIQSGEYDPTKNLGQFAKEGGVPDVISRVMKEYYKTHEVWNKGKGNYEPYGPEFTEEFKENVRELYNRRCFYCGRFEIENIRKLDVHHIDGNKKNNAIENLIPLCVYCHASVTNKMCKEVVM